MRENPMQNDTCKLLKKWIAEQTALFTKTTKTTNQEGTKVTK